MRTVLRVKQERGAVIHPRAVIPNDTKMFAQASSEDDIESFVSADSEARKVYDLLEQPGFGFIDIRENDCTPDIADKASPEEVDIPSKKESVS